MQRDLLSSSSKKINIYVLDSENKVLIFVTKYNIWEKYLISGRYSTVLP